MAIYDDSADIADSAVTEEKEGSEDDGMDEEARRNLTGFFELIWKVAQREARLEGRLKKEPDGFPAEGTYSCLICGYTVNESTGWYHWGGHRCLLCHKAIVDGVIPAFVVREHDSYYCLWKVKSMLNIHVQTVKKLIREGKITARIILGNDGKPHEYIILKKENPHLVDPDRKSPGRKSYDRNYHKRIEAQMRGVKEKMHKEWQKTHAELVKMRKRMKERYSPR